MNLSQTVLGITFENPTVLASGILGLTSSTWKDVAKKGAGGITTKSLWAKEHKGHPNPTIIETEHWMLNAVGLPDAGPEKANEEIADFMKDHPVPLIANIVAGLIEDYAKTAEGLVPLSPDAFEVNISCPNVEDEFGKPFACSAPDAAKVTAAVKKVVGDIPMFVKLSPNVDNIGEIAKACQAAGADGFTVINTIGPGMAIDLRSRMPILANKVGGLSGPAIKPIAVKCVADVYSATDGKCPIIGTGGVYRGEDALELMLAGATLIGIGSAVARYGAEVFAKVSNEMQQWCTDEGIDDIGSLVGGMHKELASRNG
jgi:dihydroorotate dehydrogenase (NAD+) catalytic subunit